MPKVKKQRARKHDAVVPIAANEDAGSTTPAPSLYAPLKPVVAQAYGSNFRAGAAAGADAAGSKKERRRERHTRLLGRLRTAGGEKAKMMKGGNAAKKGGETLTSTSALSSALDNAMFDEMSASTRNAVAAQKKGTGQRSTAQRRTLAAAEVSLFSSIIIHPEFTVHPLKAVREHLQNSIAQRVEEEYDAREKAQRITHRVGAAAVKQHAIDDAAAKVNATKRQPLGVPVPAAGAGKKKKGRRKEKTMLRTF
jgi:hypothetical protein